jgi:hypothetical protein
VLTKGGKIKVSSTLESRLDLIANQVRYSRSSVLVFTSSRANLVFFLAKYDSIKKIVIGTVFKVNQ